MTKASQELQVSQPFLSRSISDLEQELGFYLHVVKMFQEVDDACRELRDLAEHANKSISIVTNVSLYVPGILGNMIKFDPSIVVNCCSAKREKIIDMLREGRADFAICMAMLQEFDMETTFLLQEKGVVIYPPGHWLENYSQIKLMDLASEPFIGVKPGYGARDASSQMFQQLGIEISA